MRIVRGLYGLISAICFNLRLLWLINTEWGQIECYLYTKRRKVISFLLFLLSFLTNCSNELKTSEAASSFGYGWLCQII